MRLIYTEMFPGFDNLIDKSVKIISSEAIESKEVINTSIITSETYHGELFGIVREFEIEYHSNNKFFISYEDIDEHIITEISESELDIIIAKCVKKGGG